MRRVPTSIALALFTAASLAMWVHRMHVGRPETFGMLTNSDLFRYFYPTATFVHHELRAGHLPLWNPYQLAGQPFLALHLPALLYPPNLILSFLFDAPRALAAHAVVHVALAGFFTWLFTARLGFGVAARSAAALTYMFSGPILLGIYMVPYLSTNAWLPAILWALHGLLEEVRARWAVLLAATLGLAFLGGFAQGFVYQVQFACAYGLFGLVAVTRPGLRLRAAGLAAAAGVLAFGFVAPQLLPALELAERGTRDLGGMPLETAVKGRALPGVMLRGLLGQLEAHRWARSQGPVRWLVTVPTLTIPLALGGLLVRRQRALGAFFLGSAILTGLFILGDRGPLFPLYHALPAGGLFRNPTRIAFLYLFVVAVLIGNGLEALAREARRWIGRPAAGTAVVLLLTIAVGLEVYGRTGLGYTHPILGVPTLAAAGELAAYARTRREDGRVFLLQTSFLPKPMLFFKTGMMHQIPTVPDYEPNMPASYGRYFGLADEVWHGRLTVLPKWSPQPPEILGRLLDLMSVRYYAVAPPGWDVVRESVASFAGGPAHHSPALDVFERPAALPRAYVVTKTIVEPDRDAAWHLMTGAGFDPGREAVVVAPPGEAETLPGPASTAAARSPHGTNDAAAIVRADGSEVRVQAACGARCLLVLTDLHYPGWRAYVDGRETRIHETNGLFRGVYLDPGMHEVVYRYEPASVRIGVWLLVASLAVAATVWHRGRRRPL